MLPQSGDGERVGAVVYRIDALGRRLRVERSVASAYLARSTRARLIESPGSACPSEQQEGEKEMKRSRLVVIVAVAFVSLTASKAFAHCQIPCGIYDDALRFSLLEEEVTTIEKAIKTIEELSAAKSPNYNQIVRWVENKDHHADELSEIVTYYFMAQRLKPAEKKDEAAYSKYIGELTSLHEMIVYSMKAKQTTDLENVERLRALIEQFKASYLGE